MTGDDLRALTAAATPGPWVPGYVHIWTADERVVARDVLSQDAELVAWLRNHADALADLIDAAEAVGTWCSVHDDGQPWNLIMRMGDPLAALEADQ